MNMKKLIDILVSVLLHACKFTVAMSFWRMAFVAFLLRVFVRFPIGPLLALLMGLVWCVGNVDRIVGFARSVRSRISS
jgi:hypothetical protein